MNGILVQANVLMASRTLQSLHFCPDVFALPISSAHFPACPDGQAGYDIRTLSPKVRADGGIAVESLNGDLADYW